MGDLDMLIHAFLQARRANAKSFSLRIVGRTDLEEMRSVPEIKRWYRRNFDKQ